MKPHGHSKTILKIYINLPLKLILCLQTKINKFTFDGTTVVQEIIASYMAAILGFILNISYSPSLLNVHCQLLIIVYVH